jgi:hypothetical protein
MSSKIRSTFSAATPKSAMKGGNVLNESNDNNDYYQYKAKKYHYKCQMKLKEMQSQGKSVPSGYEKYLKPFTG